MMLVYRITRDKYADDISGQGARLYGGRWNRPGVAALYTSQARSLALLELIVHFNSAAAFKMKYKFVTYEIQEALIYNLSAKKIAGKSLSLNNPQLWDITDELFFDKKVFTIRVPSVLVPQEFNYIINPNHPLISEMKISAIQDAVLDSRLVSNYK